MPEFDSKNRSSLFDDSFSHKTSSSEDKRASMPPPPFQLKASGLGEEKDEEKPLQLNDRLEEVTDENGASGGGTPGGSTPAQSPNPQHAPGPLVTRLGPEPATEAETGENELAPTASETDSVLGDPESNPAKSPKGSREEPLPAFFRRFALNWREGAATYEAPSRFSLDLPPGLRMPDDSTLLNILEIIGRSVLDTLDSMGTIDRIKTYLLENQLPATIAVISGAVVGGGILAGFGRHRVPSVMVNNILPGVFPDIELGSRVSFSLESAEPISGTPDGPGHMYRVRPQLSFELADRPDISVQLNLSSTFQIRPEDRDFQYRAMIGLRFRGGSEEERDDPED